MSPTRWFPRKSGGRLPALVLPALLGLGVLSLFWVGFTVGSVLGALPAPGLPGPDGPPAVPPQSLGQGQVAPVAPGPNPAATLTSERTLITYTTSYYACGCTERQSHFAGQDMAGLGERQMEERNPGWMVASFSVTEVELQRVLPGFCPEKNEYRTLGVQGGHIAIFLGRPVSGLFLLKVTDIEFDRLSESDRARLEEGIVVRGDEAVGRYLEGLTD